MYVAEPDKTPCSSLNPSWHHTYKISYSRPSAKIELIVLLEMCKWIFLNSNICKLELLAKFTLVNNISTAYICFAFFEHCLYFSNPLTLYKTKLSKRQINLSEQNLLKNTFWWHEWMIHTEHLFLSHHPIHESLIHFNSVLSVWVPRGKGQCEFAGSFPTEHHLWEGNSVAGLDEDKRHFFQQGCAANP